jgi:hypothetical protein
VLGWPQKALQRRAMNTAYGTPLLLKVAAPPRRLPCDAPSLSETPKQSPPISPTDIPDAYRSARGHPGQAKREPGSHEVRRFYLLRSRIRLRLSGMTAAAINWRKWSKGASLTGGAK